MWPNYMYWFLDQAGTKLKVINKKCSCLVNTYCHSSTYINTACINLISQINYV